MLIRIVVVDGYIDKDNDNDEIGDNDEVGPPGDSPPPCKGPSANSTSRHTSNS